MKEIILPNPQIELSFPLMEALSKRRTIRKWKQEKLSLQEISNILWCACGETKPATKRSKNRRTIASACNSQLVKVYAALDTGVYLYDEPRHKLNQILDADLRAHLGTQKMMKSAQFGIVYIADFDKRIGVNKSDYADKMRVAGVETGLMSQNVYLYCASAKLNTVLLGLTDREYLQKALRLEDSAVVVYTQVVGKAI